MAEASRLRREGFDLAINLRFDFWWGALLAQTAGIPARLGYATPECRPFLTHPAPHVHGRHEAAQNLGLIAELAQPDSASRALWLTERLESARLEFPLRPEERAAALKLLGPYASTQRPLVAIHPGTRGLAKLWHAEGWAAVGDGLAERFETTVLLTGTRAEGDLCAAIAQRMRAPAIVLAGNTSLGELVALFAQCALVLGVDSGPLHLAVAAGVPTVHLYGPSDHVAFAPFGDHARHRVVRSGLECSPCHRLDWSLAEMAEHDCMRGIGPDAVLAAAEGALRAGTIPAPSLAN
jgi:heptosyltransferase-2/heptosyltransferase-3